jgi:hypothetical protein
MDGLIFVDCIIIIVCHIQAMVKFWLEYIRIYICMFFSCSSYDIWKCTDAYVYVCT